MASRIFTAIMASSMFLSAAMLGTGPASAASSVKAGLLTCDVSSGWGMVVSSTRSVSCDYKPVFGSTETYSGDISKFGVDLGYVKSGTIVWAVFAPSFDLTYGALAGTYAGATGSVTIGVGVGANVLVGGDRNAIALQPVSIEGDVGLNVSGGIGVMTLTAGGAS